MSAPDRIWTGSSDDPAIGGGIWWPERCNGTEYVRADLAEKLASALLELAAVFQAETTRTGGQKFTGTWSIPSLGVRSTCQDTLNRADALLGKWPTPPVQS